MDHKPLYIIDSGNSLFSSTTVPSSSDKRKATILFTALKQIGLDAMAIGPEDLSAGLDFFDNEIFDNFPLISLNLYNTKTNKPYFTPYTVITKGNISMGIIGLTKPIKQQDAFYFKDYNQLLKPVVKKLSATTDLIILLSSLSNDQNRNIASNFREIHCIFSSDKNTRNIMPNLFKNSVLAQSESQGKYFDFLRITVGTGKTWAKDYTLEVSRLRKKIDILAWQSKRQNAILTKKPDDKDTLLKIQKLSDMLQRNRNTLQEIMKKGKDFQNDPVFYKFSNVTQPITSSVAEDPEINSLLQ